MSATSLINPHLEGDSFFWEAGPIGVLLIHGFTATTAEMRLLAKTLHERGYTVASVLLPGHGTSPSDANHSEWSDWLTACESEYQRLAERCERVVVGGHSMGGLLALHVAAAHPEAAGILLYAPALRTLSFWTPILTPLLAQFFKTLPKRIVQNPFVDSRWQGYRVWPVRASKELLALQRATLALLPRIEQPLLIVQGRLDIRVHEKVPNVITGKVRSAIKEVRWMERSSHGILIDQEQQDVANITLEFLEKYVA